MAIISLPLILEVKTLRSQLASLEYCRKAEHHSDTLLDIFFESFKNFKRKKYSNGYQSQTAPALAVPDIMQNENQLIPIHYSRKVNSLLTKNCHGKAVQIIESYVSGYELIANADFTPEVIEKLVELHPENPDIYDPELPDDPTINTEPVQVSLETLERVIKNAGKQKSCGISYWSNELMIQLANHDQNFVKIALRLTNFLLSGKMAKNSPFLRNKLFALKKGEKIRPIISTDPWMRNAGSCVLFEMKSEISELMEPYQMGVGVSGGVEIVVHAAQALFDKMENNKQDIIVALDCRNAFNSVNRMAIREQIIDRFPRLLHYFDWTYGEPGELYDGNGKLLFHSKCGVRQGDSLSAFWFSLATISILKKAAQSYPEVTIMSIMDDVTVMGPDRKALMCSNYIAAEWKKINLDVVLDKSVIIHHREARLEEISKSRFQKNTQGHVILGAPVGTDSFIKAELRQKLEQYTKTIAAITTFPVNLAIPMIRSCIVARPNYIIRVVHPRLTEEIAKEFDTRIDSSLATLCETSNGTFNIWSNKVRILPAYLGGIGTPSTNNIKADAFSASYSAALVYIFHNLEPFYHEYISRTYNQENYYSVKRAIYDEELNGEAQNGNKIDHKRVVPSQSELAQEKYKNHHAALLEELPPMLKSLFLSQSSSGTSAWINCISALSAQHRLKTEEFHQALRYRLLLPIMGTQPGTVTQCCGESTIVADQNTYHPLCCRSSSRARTVRHDCVVKIIADTIAQIPGTTVELGFNIPRVNPQDRMPKIMDIRAVIHGSIYWIDCKITCPSAPSYVRNEGKFKSLEEGARRKFKHYEQELALAQDVTMIPFIVDDTGKLGKYADSFIDKIFGIDKSLPVADRTQQKHRQYMLKTIRTSIIRGNYRLIKNYFSNYININRPQIGTPAPIVYQRYIPPPNADREMAEPMMRIGEYFHDSSDSTNYRIADVVTARSSSHKGLYYKYYNSNREPHETFSSSSSRPRLLTNLEESAYEYSSINEFPPHTGYNPHFTWAVTGYDVE